MDFVSGQTAAGEQIRARTIVDVFTHERLAIKPGKKLGTADVVTALSRIAEERGAPKRLHCDNGSEFAGRVVDLWAYANKVTIEFSRPGKRGPFINGKSHLPDGADFRVKAKHRYRRSPRRSSSMRLACLNACSAYWLGPPSQELSGMSLSVPIFSGGRFCATPCIGGSGNFSIDKQPFDRRKNRCVPAQ